MSTEIKMPQLGESVTEGTVGRWLKQPGDQVAKYEPLLEVVTDKVDTEVPSPVAGTLIEIIVPEGETVRVGSVLALLGEAGEAASRSAGSVDGAQRANGDQSAAVAQPAAVARAVQSAGAASQGPRNTTLSPVVARLVAEHNLDVNQIPGTGAGGRVSKQDVLRYLEQRKQAPPMQPAAPPAPERRISEVISAAPLESIATAPATLPEDAELVPLTPMRRSIAEHMVRSVRTSPHVTSVIEIDLSQIIAHRSQNLAVFERQGVRLTYTAYFVQATVVALQAIPILNGSFSDDGIIIHRRINMGVAVALEEGLIVPVVRDADEKNLLGLARAVNDLSERARSRRLRPEETRDGTFTITNHGVSGSLFAMPIINQPQAGILGVGAIQKRAVVVSQDEVDAIAIKPMCYCSLTFDHRITDGATADAFLMTIKQTLENYR
ncbi:MAG: 2-oxo acid dehydrogenase subunit E2 [Chloroflexales bacterium]|nr:2-oxo acid dehydrogenase subunit E2 [Chloroflexales bacterium]